MSLTESYIRKAFRMVSLDTHVFTFAQDDFKKREVKEKLKRKIED